MLKKRKHENTLNTSQETHKSKSKSNNGVWYFHNIPLNKNTFFIFLYILSVVVASIILMNSVSISIKNSLVASYSIFYLLLFFYICYKQILDAEQNLYEKVSWLFNEQDFEIEYYIKIEQNNQKVPEQFRIDFSNVAEKEILNKILTSHKEHVINSYFKKQLVKSKKIYSLHAPEYFFLSLNCYLRKGDDKAYENRKYISSYEYKESLSDYGRIYYKLRLITELYLENNKCVNEYFPNFVSETESIMEALEKNEVVFLTYRP